MKQFFLDIWDGIKRIAEAWWFFVQLFWLAFCAKIKEFFNKKD